MNEKVSIGRYEIGKTQRALQSREPNGDVRIKRLLSPTDEQIDLTRDLVDSAYQRTLRDWEDGKLKRKDNKKPSSPDPRFLRAGRPSSHGLLLIYLLDQCEVLDGTHDDCDPIPAMGISFPESADALASAIEYLATEIYIEREMETW